MGDEKMRIYTRVDPCVKWWKNENLYKGRPLCFCWKKIKFYKGIPFFDFYDYMGIYTRKYPYVFEKYHVKKFEKQGGVICREPELYYDAQNKI